MTAPDAHSTDVPPDLPRDEYRLRLGGREWTILHTGDVLTFASEQEYLSEPDTRPPYGLVLWPAAIALAHDLATRADALRGRRVLELGAGTGLPGIVAASLGATVVQTDKFPRTLAVCEQNGARNRVPAGAIQYRLGDWTAWDDTARYDWIIGADVIYSEPTHPALRHIFATNLAPGGRLLLADPFRRMSLQLLREMESDGWSVSASKWRVGDGDDPRIVGVFDVAPPDARQGTGSG